jgi:DNA polymerase-1
VQVLTELADKHELPAMVLRFRALSKLKSTYVDALAGLVHPETGRVHTSFNQNVTVTGRLSSSDPNIQNIPVRTEEGRRIREAFIPENGWVMFSADYSQIELRILAHYSKDPVLIESFANDEDIHRRTASEIFELAPAFVTEEMRRQAKTINFGLIYGMGAFRLARELGVSQKLAKRCMDNYFKTYAGVKRFMEDIVEQARKTGRTTTLSGRIRKLPEINSQNRVLREFAERTAINTPLQGTAADFIKLAMIRVHERLQKEKMSTRMLLTVHDELLFESPPEELEKARELVRDCMENVWPLDVALKVNIKAGKNWAEAH